MTPEPPGLPFIWAVALRFLREGRTQTQLILLGIGTGVGVIVFLSALITGLQGSLVEKTLGTQAHIVLRPPEDVARPQLDRAGAAVAGRVQPPEQRLRTILDWPKALAALRATPGVTAASPTVAGSAFAFRGNANRSVALRGVDPETFPAILDLGPRLVEGDGDLGATRALVGTELAHDLGLSAGDRVRIQAPGGQDAVFTVAGVFDVGNKDLNQRWVFVSLRNAQTLLDLAGGVSTLEVKVDRIFEAEALAQRLGAATGLQADSWMKLNAQLLVGLRSQNSSSIMIQVFIIVAVVLGIASVLVVSVVQKSREIGILRAFGTSRRQVMGIFLLQGGLLGLAGAAGGCLLGMVLGLFFQTLATNPDGSPTFPVALDTALFLRTVAIAVGTGLVGAWLPARRAARMDPAAAIRHT
ncbi:ABC transporter permease [Mesoterricola sediminis]|uniref:Permease n=1 Tax=Mesoterricola sediminis TaxID=2927980 RepID=A0AA48GTR6_9BACT|nr:FtsX-like permease family protein [Mesoterricola sediminis]BDU76034.1 permease [Mesoterricola sediminis]